MANPGGCYAMHQPRLQLNKFRGIKGVLAAARADLKSGRKSFGLFSLLSRESWKFEAFHIWMHPPHLTLLAGCPLYPFCPNFWAMYGQFFYKFFKGLSSCISLPEASFVVFGTHPLRTPSTRFNIKKDPTTISGMKKTQLNTLPRASLVWKNRGGGE